MTPKFRDELSDALLRAALALTQRGADLSSLSKRLDSDPDHPSAAARELIDEAGRDAAASSLLLKMKARLDSW